MNIKDRSIEITQSQELFISRDEKVWKKKKWIETQSLCSKSECTNMHLMREEGAEKKKIEEIMVQKCPNLMKNNIQSSNTPK